METAEIKQLYYNSRNLFDSLKKTSNKTSKQIAEALGVTENTVVNLSGRLDKISIRQALLLANFLGVSIEYLINIIDAEVINK